MLANQVLQKIIGDINEIIKKDCSVWDTKGECLAQAGMTADELGREVARFLSEAKSGHDFLKTEKAAYFAVFHEEKLSYVFAVHCVCEQVEMIGQLCVNQFENLIQAYKKRVDKNRFFQQLILDNMLLVDVYNQAKKLSVEIETKRVVYVIEPKKDGDNLVMETIKGLYTAGNKDYVTSVDEGHVILIKALAPTDGYREVNEIARTIVDMLGAEAMVDTRVSYGTIIEELKDVSKCYKEASMALDVGRIFYVEKNVLAFNELGIGRLIHQLPVSLCEMFLKEVFHGIDMDSFDKETLTTVNAFFDNDLNISETARKMYLHRNTLGYRLDKILRTTGLDVKKFDDALTFKIALMVSDHMKFLTSQE